MKLLLYQKNQSIESICVGRLVPQMRGPN